MSSIDPNRETSWRSDPTEKFRETIRKREIEEPTEGAIDAAADALIKQIEAMLESARALSESCSDELRQLRRALREKKLSGREGQERYDEIGRRCGFCDTSA
jgi:hypothetical protein